MFHKKNIRGFLHLSDRAPVPSLYFLTGELLCFLSFFTTSESPQAQKYIILFVTLWRTAYQHQEHTQVYLGIPPAKKHFSDYILTKVTVYHEKQIRAAASSNCKMKFLNVSIIGLSRRSHSALSGVITSQDVTRMRPHIKMLCCDLYTYEQKAKQQGGSPHFRLCQEDNNSEIQHILTS